MRHEYAAFAEGMTITGDLKRDVERFYANHQDDETRLHTMDVAREAVRIAEAFGADAELAAQAAYLHDVSNVVPASAMIGIAERAGIPLLAEEYRFPRIVHQKLSRDMAERLFGCANGAVLEAIECHTTLRANAGLLAKVLFAADKVSWVLPGDHPYQARMQEKLAAHDLDGAVRIYLDHVWEQRDRLKLVHPWLIEAREHLTGNH